MNQEKKISHKRKNNKKVSLSSWGRKGAGKGRCSGGMGKAKTPLYIPIQWFAFKWEKNGACSHWFKI